MSLHWSAATGGFYDTAIYLADLPADAVEISAEEHALLLAALCEGQVIVAGPAGVPIAQNPPEPTDDALAAMARSRRDSELAGLRWMVERHADELALAVTPTLSAEAYSALLTHLQALRDVPGQPGFPVELDWPVLPNFIPVSGA